MSDSPSEGFLHELKRRKVVRVALVYVAAAFAALQIGDLLFPALGLPDWALSLVVGLAAVGLPIAIGLAWAFEVTPDGAVRRDAGRTDATHRATWLSRHTVAATAVLVLAAGSSGFFLRGAGERLDAPPDASIAVLPFANTSADPANEGFTNGLHDDLLTHLSRIQSIKVISRTSVMAYRNSDLTLPEIGRELGVSTILEGGVQRSGDQIRVNAQLIDVRSDEHLWAEIYDEHISVESLLGIQASIARRIAASLRATFTPAEESAILARPTENAQAYEFFLRGNEALGRFRVGFDLAAVDAAAAAFERAVALDTTFALARANLALVVARKGDDPDSAIALAEHALAVDPAIGRAHLALADAHLLVRAPDAAARVRSAYERALALAPSDPDVLYQVAWDRYWDERFDEALALATRIREVDPRSILPVEIANFVYEKQRGFQDALNLLEASEHLVVRTSDQPIVGFTAQQIRLLEALDGDTERALDRLQTFIDRFEPTPARLGGYLADFPQLIRDGDFDDILLTLAPDHPDERHRCACEWAQAWLHHVRGREDSARELWSRIADLRLAAEEAQTYAGEAWRRSGTALVLARAGRAAEARTELTRAFELLPELRPMQATNLRARRAAVATALGDVDAALRDLEYLLAKPSDVSVGRLRVGPQWDPLRSDPRFTALLQRHATQ